MIFVFLRYFGFPFAFLGWVGYRLFIKKDKWQKLKGDVVVGSFFVAAATFLFLYLANN